MNSDLTHRGFHLTEPIIDNSKITSLKNSLESLRIGDNAAGRRQPHVQIPEIVELIRSTQIQSLLQATLPNAFLVRSILFDKTPATNWKVPWHQDLTICVAEKHDTPGYTAWSIKDGGHHVQPPAHILEQMLTLRLHLDDCGPDNGPLQVLPATHLQGRLAAAQIQTLRAQIQPVVCAAPAGSILLMKPLILHASSPAAHPARRRILHLEFANTQLRGPLRWSADSQFPNSPFAKPCLSSPPLR